MIQFTISNHPTISEITRKASILELIYSEIDNKMVLFVEIHHYIDDSEIKELNKQFKLTADNTIKFDTGQLDENGEAIMIGDLDYFLLSVGQNKPIRDILQDAINITDVNGSINKKCNYSITE